VSTVELRQIEEALGITLPEAYKRLLDPFPVPRLRGNTFTDLWDDAGRLIVVNRQLREWDRGHAPWPTHRFFIGEGASGAYALDLREPAAPVYRVEPATGQVITAAGGQPFEEWLPEYVARARAEVEKDGLDPDQEPPRERHSPRGHGWLVFPLLGLLVLAVLVRCILGVFGSLP
jgi:hypothetical protein